MRKRIPILAALMLAGFSGASPADESVLGEAAIRNLSHDKTRATFAVLADAARRGGPHADEALAAAIAMGFPESLALAREAFGWRNPAADLYAAMGLQGVGLQEALDILRQEIPRLDPMSNNARWAAEMAWVRNFDLLSGDETKQIIDRALKDPQTRDLDRALHVMALATPGIDLATPGIDRDSTRDVYRRFLYDPAPEVRFAALYVNNRLWDAEMLPRLLELENGSDPRERNEASHLVHKYLLYGPEAPRAGESVRSEVFRKRAPVPYDKKGLAAWAARTAEWSRVQTLLVTGKPPEEPLPAAPKFEVRPADPVELSPDGAAPYRPGRSRTQGRATP